MQAGAFAEKAPITGDDGDFEYMLTDMDWSSEAFALKIEGDSMVPSFHTEMS
ncbi:S24 family peptidase [Sodalis glossinidius]|uniref:S24 family peptidase n=1 Tax=Sodalis glossinidius TaxID=63612 RepID=UPI0002D5F5FD|nr:S24 family peptidase [Sodalis glossinidius]